MRALIDLYRIETLQAIDEHEFQCNGEISINP